MTVTRTGLFVLAFVALAAAGCQSQRFNRLDTPEPAPQPLPSAPSGQISQSQLPPPGAASGPDQFPTAPGAATQPMDQQMAENAPDISKESMSGVWTASVAGQDCKIAMGLTKFGSTYRAAPLRCPGSVANVKGWDIKGKQLVLYDQNGSQIAALYSSGARKFDGQTSNGQGISLALSQ